MEKYISDIWLSGKGHYTNREKMYMDYFEKFIPNFKGKKVLEIGPGNGKFAHLMIEKYKIKEYEILDLESNIFDSVNYINSLNLKTDFKYTFAQNYENLLKERYDLIVSNICIPETPKEYRENLLNNLIPNCRNSMIIGQLVGSWVKDDEYKNWILNLFNKNFDIVKIELTNYKNCHVLTGTKKLK